jgi:PD-(D/E)XK nuclease superfamily protein
VLSMLQHPSRAWRWGRLVVVHPAGNTDFADACSRYRALLVDQSTFASVTVEDLLDPNVLPARTAPALRKRYLPG